MQPVASGYYHEYEDYLRWPTITAGFSSCKPVTRPEGIPMNTFASYLIDNIRESRSG